MGLLDTLIDERGLPKICKICRRHSRLSGGIFIWGFRNLDLGDHRLVLSLFGHVAARHQHWHFHRNFLDRLSYPEHPEPGRQSHAAETG